MNKELYCPSCKEYPDKITEIYTSYWEMRTYNEKINYYELSGDNLAMQEPDKIICTQCETELINK